jgi:hypothetical protein
MSTALLRHGPPESGARPRRAAGRIARRARKTPYRKLRAVVRRRRQQRNLASASGFGDRGDASRHPRAPSVQRRRAAASRVRRVSIPTSVTGVASAAGPGGIARRSNGRPTRLASRMGLRLRAVRGAGYGTRSRFSMAVSASRTLKLKRGSIKNAPCVRSTPAAIPVAVLDVELSGPVPPLGAHRRGEVTSVESGLVLSWADEVDTARDPRAGAGRNGQLGRPHRRAVVVATRDST